MPRRRVFKPEPMRKTRVKHGRTHCGSRAGGDTLPLSLYPVSVSRRGIPNNRDLRTFVDDLEDAMTGSGRVPAWRARVLLMALVLMGAALFLPDGWRDAHAEDSKNVTMLYHGSVGGKIAPCG